MKPIKTTAFLILLTLFFQAGQTQMMTGVWHGKINGQKTEVKIIRSGDSIAGTSYYYSSAKAYRRYTIKGYFDERTNEAIWWDDQLIEEKTGGIFSAPGKVPLLSRADFNCPGGGTMLLDGTSNEKSEEIKDGTVHLQKTDSRPVFTDEWDWVIDNFTVGTNDPYVIDSISLIAFHPKTQVIPEEPIAMAKKPAMVMIPPKEKKTVVAPEPEKTVAITPKTIEQKFTARKKKVFTTIPVEGDSITFSFYDNAIIDGDSISLFLDGNMLFTHIRLSDKPYNIKLPVTGIQEQSELTMVAENLGAIPPNTSYMVVMVGDKRYTANLASTEDSSAVIKLARPKKQ